MKGRCDMKRLIALLGLLAVTAWGQAPAPYPLTVNSRSATMPMLNVYRASQAQFALSFTDVATKSDITGQTVFMSWSTNQNATSVSTAAVSIVIATNGTALATFSPASLNYTPGRYIYEVGCISNAIVSVYRQGVMQINGSPYATGSDPIVWNTNRLNWIVYTQFLNTVTHGPVRAGSNI